MFYYIINNFKCEISGSPISLHFVLTSRIQVRKIPDPEKPTGVHQILKTINIICYLALYIDCFLYVYLCNRLQFLEISGSEHSKYHRSKKIIHESAKIFAFSSIKTQLKL